MRRAPGAGRLRATVPAGLTGALATGVLLVAGTGPASAAHADVVATADCNGTVAYAVTAWAGRPDSPEQPGLNALSRTNPDLDLEVSLDGGDFRPVVRGLALEPDNRFSVTGTFTLPDDAQPQTLVVRTVPQSPWGSGAPGLRRKSPEVDLSRCEEVLDRRPLWLGGGVVGGLAAWFLTRPRRRA